MIASSRFRQDARNAFQVKLIYTATLAANCYEIDRRIARGNELKWLSGFRTERFVVVLPLMEAGD